MPSLVIERSVAHRILALAPRSSLILPNCHRRDFGSFQLLTDREVMDELKQIARTKQALDRSRTKLDWISVEYAAHIGDENKVFKRFAMLVRDKGLGAMQESASLQKLRQEDLSTHERLEKSLAEIESLVQRDAATLRPQLNREQRVALGKLANEMRSLERPRGGLSFSGLRSVGFCSGHGFIDVRTASSGRTEQKAKATHPSMSVPCQQMRIL